MIDISILFVYSDQHESLLNSGRPVIRESSPVTGARCLRSWTPKTSDLLIRYTCSLLFIRTYLEFVPYGRRALRVADAKFTITILFVNGLQASRLLVAFRPKVRPSLLMRYGWWHRLRIGSNTHSSFILGRVLETTAWFLNAIALTPEVEMIV
jgi:hypothetical protein